MATLSLGSPVIAHMRSCRHPDTEALEKYQYTWSCGTNSGSGIRA